MLRQTAVRPAPRTGTRNLGLVAAPAAALVLGDVRRARREPVIDGAGDAAALSLTIAQQLRLELSSNTRRDSFGGDFPTIPAGARGSVSVFADALAVRPRNAWITRVSNE